MSTRKPREPIPWRNANGKIKWQPVDTDGRRLYQGIWGYTVWATYSRAEDRLYSPVLYRSQKRAIRKANRRNRRIWRTGFEIYRGGDPK